MVLTVVDNRFISNLIATTFMVMNLNAIMSVIFNVPAAVSSTIVASRAVRRLYDFGRKPTEVFANEDLPPTNRKVNRRRSSSVASGDKDRLRIEVSETEPQRRRALLKMP